MILCLETVLQTFYKWISSLVANATRLPACLPSLPRSASLKSPKIHDLTFFSTHSQNLMWLQALTEQTI